MVVTCLRPTVETGVMQERVGTPFRCTVQAPQAPTPQPYLGPSMPSVSRSTQRSGVSGGASTDTAHVHLAWRKSDPDLAKADFPWIADNGRVLADALGIVDKNEHVAYRATFIIDPDNVIQAVQVNGLNVGRNPAETLRVLDALQTDELCPCNWNKGDDVLQVAA